jgi:hypothetical protein
LGYIIRDKNSGEEDFFIHQPLQAKQTLFFLNITKSSSELQTTQNQTQHHRANNITVNRIITATTT